MLIKFTIFTQNQFHYNFTLTKRYLQITVDKDKYHKMHFKQLMTFHFVQIPFSSKNAPTIFARLMKKMLLI